MDTINIVLKTKDYDLFKNLEGNRNINNANLQRIKKSMQEEHLQVPIIVNEKYQIIDGHHRFTASKILNLPIYFIIVPGYRLPHVHRLNAVSKKWSFEDFLDGYANMGLQDYITARRFYRKYKFGSHETLSLLLNLNSPRPGTAYSNDFVNGRFKVVDINEAEKRAEMIRMVKPYYDGYMRRSFVFAMLNLFGNDDFNFTTFLQKLKYQSKKLVDCTTTKHYLMVIEEIYNYKSRDKVRFI